MESKSLVVLNKAGEVIALEQMNKKAHQKSLENGILWYLHETGRVLPYSEEAKPGYLAELKEESFCFTARVNEGSVDQKPSAPDDNKGAAAQSASDSAETPSSSNILKVLEEVIASRHREMPEGSYTTHLFTKGPDKIRKKLGEEAVELILARDKEEIVYEAADLFYHTLVLLEALEIGLDEIFNELEKRH